MDIYIILEIMLLDWKWTLILEFSDGKCSAVVRDPETGIYIVPITALKP